ncbi:MAG: ribonuclease III [Pseudomonadota bacterium]
MKLSGELNAFSDRLGYQFKTPAYLIEAVTHPSFGGAADNNQRMEFLGDRVLGLVMANALFDRLEDADEGVLAPQFNGLVRKEACAEVARTIDLGACLKMGRSEMQSGGRRKEALLADAMEAVIAAVYLDAGFEATQTLVLRLWAPMLERAEHVDARDAKTLLQEWAQAHAMPPPKYTEVGRTGPDHAPEFEIEAILQSGERARAKATSKRQAQQIAAKDLLDRLS